MGKGAEDAPESRDGPRAPEEGPAWEKRSGPSGSDSRGKFVQVGGDQSRLTAPRLPILRAFSFLCERRSFVPSEINTDGGGCCGKWRQGRCIGGVCRDGPLRTRLSYPSL